jgi:hypothetical protein
MTTHQSALRTTPSELNSYTLVCQTVSGMVFSTRVKAKNRVDAQHQMYDDLRVAKVLKVM